MHESWQRGLFKITRLPEEQYRAKISGKTALSELSDTEKVAARALAGTTEFILLNNVVKNVQIST